MLAGERFSYIAVPLLRVSRMRKKYAVVSRDTMDTVFFSPFHLLIGSFLKNVFLSPNSPFFIMGGEIHGDHSADVPAYQQWRTVRTTIAAIIDCVENPGRTDNSRLIMSFFTLVVQMRV